MLTHILGHLTQLTALNVIDALASMTTHVCDVRLGSQLIKCSTSLAFSPAAHQASRGQLAQQSINRGTADGTRLGLKRMKELGGTQCVSTRGFEHLKQFFTLSRLIESHGRKGKVHPVGRVTSREHMREIRFTHSHKEKKEFETLSQIAWKRF